MEGKTPEIPSSEGKILTPLDKMDNAAIEEELTKGDVELPPRWFFYNENERRGVLQKVREGKIPPGYKWPGAKIGSGLLGDKEKKELESQKEN